MSAWRSWSGVVAVAVATTLVAGLDASAQRNVRPSIYVLAVKDTGALTMCADLREAKINGKTWKPDGRAMAALHVDDLQFLRFPPRDTKLDSKADPRLRTEFSMTQAILPLPPTAASGGATPASADGTELGRDIMAPDPWLKVMVEQELAKLGTHAVAESLENADLVMLVDGSYSSSATSSTPTIAGNLGERQPPALVAVAQAGDWERNLLQSILAVIAPAESYRSHPGDIPALMAARIWEGSEVAQPPYRVTEQSRDRGITRYETQWTWESASVGALVWQFAGKKPRPASHLPLCAASNQPFRMASAGSGFPVVPTPADRGTPSAIPPAGGSGRTAMFKGGVTYVTVPVSVVDGEGKILTDLNLSSFRVFEDDQLQSVDRLERPGAAVSVTLLVDSSSSMRRRYDETRDAIKAAVTAFKDVGTMSMVSFDRRIVLYTTPPADLFRRQPGPNEPSPSVGRSATRFYDAIDLVLTGPLNTTSGRTALVILTDGVDTASRLATAEGARRRLGESHTPAYVIQYDTQQDAVLIGQGRGMNLIVNGTIPELTRRLVPENAADPGPAYARAAEFLRDIADVSGGRRYAAQGGADLPRTLNEIATELGQQYLLAYYPTNQARDGTYRRIRVEVDRPGANVRARAGYLQVPPSLGGR